MSTAAHNASTNSGHSADCRRASSSRSQSSLKSVPTGNPQRLRCPNCRTRRTDPHAMVLHQLRCRQVDCTCGGYHFKHRQGSPLCVGNPWGDLNAARARGETPEVLEDIFFDTVLSKPAQRATACPF
jgi:hypothetical protein